MGTGRKFDSGSLAALGAERLAGILYELAESDASIKRWLKLELAGAERAAGEIRKRLATIGRSRSFIDWHKMRAFADDLEAQRRAIVRHVAPDDPADAFDLLWQFLGLAPSLYGRCDDSNGVIGGILAEAREDLGRAAKAAALDPKLLADKVFDGARANDHGQHDNLIALMAEPLGREGLLLLKARFEDLAANPPQPPPKEKRRVIGWSPHGALHEDDLAARRHARLVRSALTEIVDALGDVDGYILRFSKAEQANPAVAARIAERLLGAARTGEALAALGKAEGTRRRGGHWPDWDRVRIAALEASGRREEAQQARLALFEAGLDAAYLRAYLGKLPDFDNDEAEARALAHAASFGDVHQGLWFLTAWPAVDAAARMILARRRELDGDRYEVLTPAAEALEARHPLAATLVLRAMIEFALEKARAKRYPHAARHLATCAGLAGRIERFAPYPDHAAYVAGLKARHGRKSGFWKAE